jgi:hypothetical protein
LTNEILPSIFITLKLSTEFEIKEVFQLYEYDFDVENPNNMRWYEIIKSSLGYESLGEIIADYSRKIEGDVIMLMTQQEISHTPYFVSSLAQEVINISEVPVITIAPN